jgi:hypothetical protein
MNKPLSSIIKSILVGTLLTTASTGAQAGAVFPKSSTAWDMGMNHIMHAGQSISASNQAGDKQSYTSNPDLHSASWGHFGSWYTFMTHDTATTTISVTATDATSISPGFTVWKTDGQFDGGTGGTGEKSSADKGTPHSFNQVGAAGDWGTIWMTDNSVSTVFPNGFGNTEHGILQTMGYANDGKDYYVDGDPDNLTFGQNIHENGWGDHVHNDGNQNGHAELTLVDLEAGWYLIFMGGADGSLMGTGSTNLNLNVSSVPVPAAAYLFGSALIGLFASRRKVTTTQA